MEEARSKLNGSLRMYQYHGQSRNRDVQSLATDYDLVVTTYQVVSAEGLNEAQLGPCVQLLMTIHIMHGCRCLQLHANTASSGS